MNRQCALFALCAFLTLLSLVSAAPQAASSAAAGIDRRDCACAFPLDAGLVAVTPDKGNGGWAMSPDQRCTCGSWCPFSCPSGFLSSQWNPDPTASRMDGGYHCSASGTLELGRPSEPLCFDARGEVTVRTEGLAPTHLCQTVFPGTENMLIANEVPVGLGVQLAIPNQRAFHIHGNSDAAGAQYYVNPHGLSKDDACSWGSKGAAHGNWAPYSFGVVRGFEDRIFISTGWNPAYLENESPFRTQKPNFGFRVECKGDGCLNAGCSVDPSVNGVNEMAGDSRIDMDTSIGPAHRHCITVVPEGVPVELVLFEK